MSRSLLSPLATAVSLFLSVCVITSFADTDTAPSLTHSDSFPLAGASCCMRIPKETYLGLDSNGVHLTVDVGECVDICRDWVTGFGGLQRCHGECFAKRTTMETYKLLTGDKEVSVIKSCRCGDAGRCRRLRKKVIYYPDTEFEVQVDEGQCSSQSGCGSNTSCQAVNFDLKAILSPKGVRNVPVVKECKCVGGCYRLPHYKELSLGEEAMGVVLRGAGGEREGSGEVRGQGEEGESGLVLTVVDVGRCAGTCPSSEQRCIPARDNPEECQITLTPSTPPCLPVAMEPMQMPVGRNNSQTIWRVSECGCGH